MKTSLYIFCCLLMISCGNKNSQQAGDAGSNPAMDLSTAEGLCFYVMGKAEQETGENKPPQAVVYSYRESVCPELTKANLDQWRCMKDQIDSGKKFYEADEQCADS